MLLLLALAALVWFWAGSLRVRERALARCATVCRDMQLQFLDQTVGLRRLGLGRGVDGRMRIRRRYDFEFSISGADRHKGMIVMLGQVIEQMRLEHPDGPIIIDEAVRNRINAGA